MPVGRTDLILLTVSIGARPGTGGLGGITRLQKLVFLLGREGEVSEVRDFEFAPYKAGPYSAKLYDDLELLENLGLVESVPSGPATAAESEEIDALTFDELVGAGDPGERGAPDAFEERKFFLSEAGRRHVEQLMSSDEHKGIVEAVRRISSRYASHSLDDLLHYIYTRYPEMAVESEIRDRVLSRRRN